MKHERAGILSRYFGFFQASAAIILKRISENSPRLMPGRYYLGGIMFFAHKKIGQLSVGRFSGAVRPHFVDLLVRFRLPLP